MKSGKLLEWIKSELIALGKDFFWGAVTLIFILLLIMGLGSVTNVLLNISSFITENLIFQIILALGILSFLGIISRKLQKSKRFSPFKKFLPAEIFKKPEVAYFSGGNKLTLGILIKIHSIRIEGSFYEMGEIVPTQGAPTSGGHLSGKLVPIDDLYSTGRTYGQSLAACMSFGTKMSPINDLVPFNMKGEKNFNIINAYENSVGIY
jgi:hypothetical protein